MSKIKNKEGRKLLKFPGASKAKVEQEIVMEYEKKIYDLEQMLDIAQSLCQNLNFNNLLESIVYITMAQMRVIGAEIFVKDLITNENFTLETSKGSLESEKLAIPVNSELSELLLDLKKSVTMEELQKKLKPDNPDLETLKSLMPTLVVPLIQKGHLNGILVLQERIVIDDDSSYTEYEQNQMMTIASLASVAINNASLLEMSSTDMMTRLKLKYYFYNCLTETIDTAIMTNNQFAVLMFDIDFFKKFNDTYGHECGDFVLINVADLIRKSLRDADIASRYGGEEFTVLINITTKEEALLVAERIRSSIDNYDFVFNGQHLHVTISGGVTLFNTDTNLIKNPNEIVNQADQALYESKRNGRNQISFFEVPEKPETTEDKE